MTKILIDEATVKLVLEALECTPTLSPAVEELCDAAITALREVLASEAKEQPAQQEQNNLLDCGMYLGAGKTRAIKHRVSYGIEPVDTLIAAWQAIEETSGHVLDEGDVEGRMHVSVIRSAWEQMDSFVRDMWDERGRK